MNYFSRIGTAGQVIIIILFILSAITVYIFIERYLTIKSYVERRFFSLALLRIFLHDGKFSSAIDLCENTDTPVADLKKGIIRFDRSLDKFSILFLTRVN